MIAPSSHVLLAEVPNEPGLLLAVKVLRKDVVLEDDDVECVRVERAVLALGTLHPFLTQLHSSTQSPGHLFIAMSFHSGGDLMFHIQMSSNGKFSLQRATFYAAELVSSLQFLHGHRVMYRHVPGFIALVGEPSIASCHRAVAFIVLSHNSLSYNYPR
ncbi:unnamed protein product [Protopolystoma xenopodis]|uniref:non-specific serine/threonine protein kinase n=1 Tax=Protopolystoma xenopodis TaxID=117903 RepID=A0A448XH62_9PLAT|nr:unnamed protein product [Protopolystoma xenopodis]